jgi:N-acetylglucosaminyldiphosphoundecaprenol N-acetyl-beta-D-mannosaminyltransferase
VNGTDLFPRLCAAAARADVPIALLGARPGVAAMCAQRMQERLPGLRVVWTAHGYLTAGEEALHLQHLNASGARILLVAKGVPMQEHWIARNGDRIEAPVLLGVGALLDFYSGTVPRAPRLVRQLKAEWVFRLLQEPRRLARRYLLGNPAFIARILRWRASGRSLRSAGAGR